MRERESSIEGLRTENYTFQQRIRAMKEELAERDGQLRVAKMNLETAQKQNQMQMAEVGRYEESLAALHTSLEKSQTQYTSTHAQLVESQQGTHDLQVQLTTLQANNKETMLQLADKARQGSGLKTDLDHAQHQNQAMAEEVGVVVSRHSLLYSTHSGDIHERFSPRFQSC